MDSIAPVRLVENRSPGGLIDAAGLHADVSVFHDVDLADAMFAAEDVQFLHQRRRGERLAVHLDRNSLVKFNDHFLRRIRVWESGVVRTETDSGHAFHGSSRIPPSKEMWSRLRSML